MKWFKKAPTTGACRECKHIYELEQRSYADLCAPCAKPHQERDNRKAAVIRYAEANWEKLEENAKNWAEHQARAFASAINSGAIAQQQAQMRAYQGPKTADHMCVIFRVL